MKTFNSGDTYLMPKKTSNKLVCIRDKIKKKIFRVPYSKALEKVEKGLFTFTTKSKWKRQERRDGT